MSTHVISSHYTTTSNHTVLQRVTEFSGRLLLSLLFLGSGLSKLGAYAGTAAYMASVGVPSGLLPAVIAIEVLGAVSIIVGWQTRLTAFLLAGFSLVTAFLFHNNFADQIQMIMFMKNVAIAGGFLGLVVNGAGWLSVDRLLRK